MQVAYKITLKENGRLVLPIKLREQFSLQPGDQLLFEANEAMTVTPLKSSIQRFQQRIKQCNKKNISLVESLKQTRQEEG